MRTFPRIPGQHDLATVRQLVAVGWTYASIHRYLGSMGQAPMPGVVCAHRGPLSSEDALIASWLWAGQGAMLTGGHALRRHGVPLARPPLLQTFVVPDDRRNREFRNAETLHAHAVPAFRTLNGLPVVCVERALLDCSRSGEFLPDEVRASTIAALQTRLTSVARLRHALGATRPNGTRGVRQGLRDFAEGAWSVPEVVLARLLSARRRSLAFVVNRQLLDRHGVLIGTPDAYLPDHAVAIQVHSHEYHAGLEPDGRDRWAATVESDARYAPHGIAAVAVAPTTLRDRPAGFLTLLDRVIVSQRGRRRPFIILRPVGGGSDHSAA